MLAVCVLGWIQDRNITEAIHLGKALFDHVAQWSQGTLLVSILFVCSLYFIHDVSVHRLSHW